MGEPLIVIGGGVGRLFFFFQRVASIPVSGGRDEHDYYAVSNKTVFGIADELKDHTVSCIHSFEERFVVRYIHFTGEPELGIEVFRAVWVVTSDFSLHGDSVS